MKSFLINEIKGYVAEKGNNYFDFLDGNAFREHNW